MFAYIYLKIAGFVICLRFRKTNNLVFYKKRLENDIKHYFHKFIVPKLSSRPDYTIIVKDITQMNFYSYMNNNNLEHYVNYFHVKEKNIVETYYHISFLQLQRLLLFVLQDLLKENNGFILHSSSVDDGGQALLFLGKQGAGKSTAAKLLSKVFPTLMDDFAIVKQENNKFYCYQIALIDKALSSVKGPEKYPIKLVYFLKKSKNFKTRKITDKEYILKRIIDQFWTLKSDVKKQTSAVINFVNSFDNFNFLFFDKNEKTFIDFMKNIKK